MLSKIWDWIEKNRWTVIIPVAAMMVWTFALSCTPITENPVQPGQQVTAKELSLEFSTWQKQQEIIAERFEFAGQDLEEQQERLNQVKQAIITIASGGVADLPGLLKLLMSGGIVGLFADNIRKNGVIGGLKRNKS